jgi:bifunctional UDP-N-acetylglucosamine pyrophosphorylase/glucosamine-1-phosphate N-acetyltransferase
VEEAFAGRATFRLQSRQRGTGHAVQQALPALEGFAGDVLILYGDTPLLRASTLERMRAMKARDAADLVMLTTRLPLPGRVARDAQGRVARIVETTDATPEELALPESNTGVYLLDVELLAKGLAQLDDRNAQGELYLTDIVERFVSEKRRVEALLVEDPDESLGVNTRAELARAAALLRARNAERHMAAGVTLEDPASTWIDTDVEIGPDTVIEPGAVIRGGTRIGPRVRVKAHSVIEASRLDEGVVVGPSAHLRPGSHLMAGARVGNFVEVKNSVLGPGVKADHLSYIGDADVGARASFGCGSIVVNYDGIRKHRTAVEDGAFIGCNVNLVAPLRVGRNAFVAAGSTLTRDVPEDALAVARERQREIAGWAARRRERAPEGESSKPVRKKTRPRGRGRRKAARRPA